MKINEIEHYLMIKNRSLDEKVEKELEEMHQVAVSKQNEQNANYYWCLRQIYKIQKGFLSAIYSLKNKKYETAWETLDSVDIAIGCLEGNFDIEMDDDKFHMVFIGRMIKEYQKLFPYHHFFSRESIVKAEKCSICGKPASLRNPCGHKVGKLYMGELCLREVTEIEFKAFCIVTDPFDKYSYVQLPDKEYDYGMLEALMKEINDPYDEFSIEIVKVIRPEYRGVRRNDICPCGSGKKYKKCHLGTKEELMDHYKVHFAKKGISKQNRFLGLFGTWK